MARMKKFYQDIVDILRYAQGSTEHRRERANQHIMKVLDCDIDKAVKQRKAVEENLRPSVQLARRKETSLRGYDIGNMSIKISEKRQKQRRSAENNLT